MLHRAAPQRPASSCTVGRTSALGFLAHVQHRVATVATQPLAARRPGRAAAGDDERGQETAEQAKLRRLRESAQVESRVTFVETFEEVQDYLVAAGDKLVVLEVQSDVECQSGLPEPELHWRQDQKDAARRNIEACQRIKHSVQRIARECENVLFLEMHIPNDAAGDTLKDRLGVDMVPSILFIKRGQVLWQDQGYSGMEQDMGEAVLYYNHGSGGVRTAEHVPDVLNAAQLALFVNNPDPRMLVVLDVSTTMCKPCVRVFPAVLALSRSFAGHVQFGRLLGDTDEHTEQLMKDLHILEAPTFVFYRGGQEVGRLVSGDRGDLIGHILQLQADAGIKPPPPPPGASRARARQRTVTGRR